MLQMATPESSKSSPPAEFYSIRRAAQILRVHQNTIRNWIARDWIEAEKYGGTWRIPREQIRRKFDEQRTV